MTSPAYTACQQRIEDIEQALESLETTRIKQLAQELTDCLAAMKQSDEKELSPVAAAAGPGLREEMSAALLARIKPLISRISGIMAQQRDEMSKLKLGQETARGYAMGRSPRTGAIINSAN